MSPSQRPEAAVLHEDSCPLDPIAGWTVAILGFGNQGRAHAANLRDAGFEVLIASDATRPSARRAQAEGYRVVPIAEARVRADAVALLAPDEHHRTLLEELRAGPGGGGEADGSRIRLVVAAHGFGLLYDAVQPDPRWDIAVVAPAGPGVQVRERFVAGGGVPALVAVHRDASGAARGRALAYARALGCARAGIIETTVREEVEVDLFGEQAVLCGGMNALLESAFQVLVDAGYAPEMAYLECVQQLRLTAELVERYGIAGMRERISTTAQYGDLTRGSRVIAEPARAALREILGEIRSGAFARERLALEASDPQALAGRLAAARQESLESAGNRVRRLFEEKR